MKINTISTYVLVYLLTNGHWNLMVPVKADSDPDGSTGGVVAGDATSTGGASGSSSESAPANEGSTSGDANASLATPASEADGSSSASADGASTDANAYLSSGTVATPASEADGGSSASADSSDGSSGQAAPATETVLLNGLYPDSYTSGWHVDMVGPDPKVIAKRIEALSLAAEARKAADELLKAAEKLNKEAEVLTKAVEDSVSSVANEDKIEELNAKIADTTAKVNVEMKQADMIAHEHDMYYYSGFPNGWHAEHDPVLEKDALLSKTLMYRDSFPNPWHDMNWPMLDETQKNREKKYKQDKEGMKVKIDGKEAQIVLKEEQIASKNSEMVVKKEELEDKNEELNAKKQEVSDLRELIKELNKDLKKLELEARNLATEHGSISRDYIRLDVEHRKLEEDRSKLQGEFLSLLEEDRKIVKEFYDTTGSIGHLHDKHGKDRYGLYSETDRKVDPRDTFSPYNVDVHGLKHYDPTIPTEVTKAYLGDLYPDMGGSLVIVKKPKELEVHKDVEFNPVDNFSEYPAIIGRGREAKASESSKVGNDKTKVEPPAPEASVPATVVPGAGSTEAKPVAESPEAKAPEVGAKVEESAPVSTAAPAHTAGHVAVPEAKAEVAAPAHSAGHAAVPEAKAEAQAAPTGVKFYKTGSDGSMVEMVENTDYEKKQTVGDDRFDFKTNAKCEKITFDGQDVWKKGDQDVKEPRSVTYRDSLKVLVVRDNDWTVNFKKDNREGVWKLESKTQRAARTGSASTASTPSSRTGLASQGLARGIAGGSTTNLASSSAKFGGSVTNLETTSTTGSDESKSSGSSDVANLKEFEEPESGSAGTAGATTLRGTGMAGSTAGRTALSSTAKKVGQQ